ncbi:MAG: radical SAM protein [Syntrophomonadaceae bacterium]|nr:radical SAM protein [Syntrophomonadaceae bacterium]
MKCTICERFCKIPEGRSGACGLYLNQGNEIVERYPNRYLITTPISIETMPMLHYYPGNKFLQVSTAGCNFSCSGCISTVIAKEMEANSKALRYMEPEEVVAMAKKQECLGITFLINDPLASFITFTRLAQAAKKAELLVGCSSNTYFSEESLASIIPYLDFINIGSKGLSDETYRRCGGNSVAPVLRNLKTLYNSGVHVEVSCILENDNKQELLQLAQIISDTSIAIPLQVMRFIPFEDADPEREISIQEAEEFLLEVKQYLPYVYLFNSPGTSYLNTPCPQCDSTLYRRDFYGPMGAKLKNLSEIHEAAGFCPHCGQASPIGNGAPADPYQEGGFEGGYPFTRALEMIQAILITLGVEEKGEVAKVWEEVLKEQRLQELHHQVQDPRSYLALVRCYGQMAGRSLQAEALAGYMEEKIALIEAGYPRIKRRPRVYYCMGKPLFAIKGERLENQLVEAAGGCSVNKEIAIEGRPGETLTPTELMTLNPEVVFISAFISTPVESFYQSCKENSIDIPAIRDKRVYLHPSPSWDFGNPRWILGLMNMANLLHPDIYHFDIEEESRHFYREFYQTDYEPSAINRSFSKPTIYWSWR